MRFGRNSPRNPLSSEKPLPRCIYSYVNVADIAAGYCTTVNPRQGHLKRARGYLWTPGEPAGSFQFPPRVCTSSERYRICLPGRLPAPEATRLVPLLSITPSPPPLRHRNPSRSSAWLFDIFERVPESPAATPSRRDTSHGACVVPSCEKSCKRQPPGRKPPFSSVARARHTHTHTQQRPTYHTLQCGVMNL